MPPPRGKRTTLTVDRETFEEFFMIDSGGFGIASDAMAAGLIGTPYEAIAMVCLANQLMSQSIAGDTVDALEPLGKVDAFIAAEDLGDFERADQLVVEQLGPKRVHEMWLAAGKKVRDELGIPEFERRARRTRSSPATESDDEDREPSSLLPVLPKDREAAFVRIAPWRFERHFRLDGHGHWIALDAFRQGVIGTPYETVEMICNVNLMASVRLRAIGAQSLLNLYPTAEELDVAMQNGTIAEFPSRALKSEAFQQRANKMMLEIRKAFGVPETEERGKAEKYKLWAASRRKPVN